MTVGGTYLDHAEQWAAIVDDLGTLRILKDGLERAIASHHKVADGIADPALKVEFNEMFADDIARCEKALEVINARLGH